MSLSSAERRQVENEMIFRRKNEKVADDLAILDAMHIEEGNGDLTFDDDLVLGFKCECSDEDCTERIFMKLSLYEKIHAKRDAFVIKPNHQVDTIEEIVKTTSTYTVVKKNVLVPEPTGGLNKTSVDNS